MILRGFKGDINITYILIHYGATLIGASLVKTTQGSNTGGEGEGRVIEDCHLEVDA